MMNDYGILMMNFYSVKQLPLLRSLKKELENAEFSCPLELVFLMG
jgi:hypothetical protein